MDQKPTIAEPVEPKRRWYQFRLRTLLIGVALLGTVCGYVAYEAAIVAERKTWLETHALKPFSGSHAYTRMANGDPRRSPGLLRAWLGDLPQTGLEVRSDMSPKELDEAIKLFPEAIFISDGFRD